MCMLKGDKYEHQRHISQLRPKYTHNVIEEQKVPMGVLYVFDVPAPPIPINQEKEESGTF